MVGDIVKTSSTENENNDLLNPLLTCFWNKSINKDLFSTGLLLLPIFSFPQMYVFCIHKPQSF